jgi:peptidoglycan hydrolase-like protein with peptidoglycan-binding domain
MAVLRRIVALAAAAALVAVVAGVGYWAGRNAVVPPELPVDEHETQTYAVATGSVGRSIDLPVSASWSTTRTLFAGSDGIVTSVLHEAGALADAGDVLATIDLEPVVIAEGAVPMFRTLERGMTGPDVAQLQELLRSMGFLDGPADGAFGPVTEAAVKRWQRSIGASQDGIVDPGALLFVAGLPVRLEVSAIVGARIGAGSDLARVLGERPAFVATISPSQRAELATGMTVEITGPEGETWPAELGPFEAQPDGRYQAPLSGALCGDACDGIAVAGETALTGSIELVPETEGLVVPTSALVEQPSGGLAVTLADGGSADVRIVVEADGFAVVEGLALGTVIVLPSPP